MLLLTKVKPSEQLWVRF